jgi:L-lysine 6-transaminase
MVRSQRFIEIITEENLVENVARQGQRFLDGLRALGLERGGFTNVRGLGSLVAFTLPTPAARDALLGALRTKHFLALSSGESSIRFRMPLNVSSSEVDLALERVAACLPARRVTA